MIIKTMKVKCRNGYDYFVSVTDGLKNVRFINDGENKVTIKDLSGCEIINGNHYFTTKDEPGKLYRLPYFGKKENNQHDMESITNFINSCLTIPVIFGDNNHTKLINGVEVTEFVYLFD